MPFSLFNKIITPSPQSSIVVVSGLPRSGTSMMMSMLKAGGLEILTDHERSADESNPKGYFEFERAKKLQDGDKSWVADARGKAVKVISALLKYLPEKYQYRIIFMHRDMQEILNSQRRMLEHNGKKEDEVLDEKMAELFENHLIEVKKWLSHRNNIQVLEIDYNDILVDPQRNVSRIVELLRFNLDQESMIKVIDPNLYRERK